MGRVAAPSAPVSSLLDTPPDLRGAAGRTGPRRQAAPSGSERWREAAWIALVVAISTAVTAAIASRSYWVSDDFLVFQDASAGGYDYEYLVSRAIVHFSPGHRLGALVIQREAISDYNVALALLLVFQAASVVLVQRVVRWFAGPVWWSYALALGFGLSPILFVSLEWFGAGLMVLPPTAFTLAALHAYLSWWETRRRGWLIWSVVAVAGALAFYEKAALVPVYLVLVRVLLVDERRTIAANVRQAAREWRVWALYAGVVVVWFIAYQTRDYADSWHVGDLGKNLVFLRISWFESFVPGALGMRITGREEDLARVLQAVVAQAVLLGAVAASVRRRRAAWRAWALLAIAFLLNSVLLFPRVAEWPPALIGHTLRYQTELLMLLPLVLAAAFARGPHEGASRPPRRAWRPVLAGMAALAVFAAVAISNMDAISDGSPGPVSKRYFASLSAGLDRLQRDGASVNLLDEQMPAPLIAGWLRPGDERLSRILPLFHEGLRFNVVDEPIHRVRIDGRIVPVRFDREAGGDLGMLIDRGFVQPAGGNKPYIDKGLCLRASGRTKASMELLPPRTLRGRRWYLRADYSTGSDNGIMLAVNRGVPYPETGDQRLAPAPAGGKALVDLGALPTGTPTFGGVRFDVPPGGAACFTRLEVGAFTAAAG